MKYNFITYFPVAMENGRYAESDPRPLIAHHTEQVFLRTMASTHATKVALVDGNL
jgi:hypothetical protein